MKTLKAGLDFSSLLVVCLLSALFLIGCRQQALAVPRALEYQVYEVKLEAKEVPENPFTDVQLTAAVTTPSGKKLEVEGFYDGNGKGGQQGKVWKLRFSPNELGRWEWVTRSNLKALDGKHGAFECVKSDSPGPIVAKGHYFYYATGRPVYLAGNFLDDSAPPGEQYSHCLFSEKITDAQRQSFLKRQLEEYKVNKLNLYLANKGDYHNLSVTPWVGTAEHNDKTRFDLSRWTKYEKLIAQLNRQGVVAELWFFADDSDFGRLSQADQERLIRYGMARLSAFPNTMFVFALEWQEGWSPEAVLHYVAYGQAHNPWRRLWSVHGVTGDFSFPNAKVMDFMATQSGNDITPGPNNEHTIRNRALAEKPLIVEECGHTVKGDNTRVRGNLWAAFCGGAAGTGTGSGIARLRRFLAEGKVAFWRMHPDNSVTTKGFALVNPGLEYVVYLPPNSGEFTLRLPYGRYEVEWFNPRPSDEGLQSAPSRRGGKQTFTTPDAGDWVLHLKRRTYASRTPGKKGSDLIQNGWFVFKQKVIWGWVEHNGWWRPGQRPNLCRRSVGDPQGDVRPNRTEDLDKLTDNMLKYGYPGFEHNFGLWYDRRRDAHDTARRTTPDCKPPFLEQPWARSGIGQAWDGKSKYDLERFNDWYFMRVKQFADLCDQKGTVLFYKLYMQHALLETPAHYVDFPWRPDNCIQDTGMPESIPAANVFYDVSNPVRRKLHRLYIRKCLDVLGDNRNVVFLPSEEYTGPLSFVQFYIDTIVEWERETGKHVNIGVGAPKDVLDAILADPVRSKAVDVIDLRYWWYRKDGSLNAIPGGKEVPGRGLESGWQASKETSPEMEYKKIRSYRDAYPEKGIIDALNANRQEAWAFWMGGGSLLVRGQIEYPNHSDPPTYIKPADMDIILPSYEFVRQHLAAEIPAMRPADLTARPENNWCLANPGESYLLYALYGGEVQLDLAQAKGKFELTWFNPRTGEVKAAEKPVKGGKHLTLNCPDDQDWVIWLKKH